MEQPMTPTMYGAVEHSPAQNEERVGTVPPARGWSAASRVGVLVVLAAVVAVVGAVALRRQDDATVLRSGSGEFAAKWEATFTTQTMSTTQTPTQTLKFTCSNEYSNDAFQAGAQYNWVTPSLLVEPYRPSKLNVSNIVSNATYEWIITTQQYGQFNSTRQQGSSTEYTCTSPGKINVTLLEYSIDALGTHHRRIETDVQCRYVRREFRGLHDGDASKLLKAMQIVYTMPESSGRKLYGHHYAGITSFVDAHNTLAGSQYCDHMHDGFGFMNQHVALTRWFEYVLQLIDPSVSMPYWDYTIEGQLVNRSGDMTQWKQSEFFSGEWFGSVDGYGAITTGQIAYVTSYYNANNVSSMANAYGFMRAPWNQNKDPYVSRFNISYGFEFTAPPDCESHYQVMNMKDWEGFGKEIMYNPHGPVHLLIGGVGNADWKNVLERLNVNFHIAMLWAPSAFSLQKNMWRNGKLRCPATCSLDTPMEDCKCTCPHLEDWLAMPEATLIKEVFSSVFANQSLFFTDKFGDFVGYDLLKLLCNARDKMAPVFGESLESASPGDPSFWPIHPTVERLLTWRRIHGFRSINWLNNVSWSVRGYEVGYCWGHNYDDVLSWPDYIFAQTGWSGPYTNEDVWKLTDPTATHLPYIFDNFYWDHCEASGYPSTLIV